MVGCRTSHGARAGSRGARAGIRSASPSKLVFQLEVTPCYVVCPLCFAFDMYTFLNKMMILTQCAHCFVQIQHVEMTPCLWCAHCVLHLTRTLVFNQNDDIDSVCAMFCAN